MKETIKSAAQWFAAELARQEVSHPAIDAVLDVLTGLRGPQ